MGMTGGTKQRGMRLSPILIPITENLKLLILCIMWDIRKTESPTQVGLSIKGILVIYVL